MYLNGVKQAKESLYKNGLLNCVKFYFQAKVFRRRYPDLTTRLIYLNIIVSLLIKAAYWLCNVGLENLNPFVKGKLT
jgi:hypothetical protein